MKGMVLWDLMPCISRKYEEYGVMGSDAMYCHRQVLTFQRNLLPFSSALNSKLGS